METKIIHKNPWFAIREDTVKRPNGTDGKYFYISGSKSVIVIVEDDDKDLYLVGQTRYPIGNLYSWEFISGGVAADENFLDAAKRELEEEGGIVASQWDTLGSFYPLKGYADEVSSVYLARDLRKVSEKYEVTEDISLQKLSLNRILSMVKDGEISCGMTMAALQKYLLFKEEI